MSACVCVYEYKVTWAALQQLNYKRRETGRGDVQNMYNAPIHINYVKIMYDFYCEAATGSLEWKAQPAAEIHYMLLLNPIDTIFFTLCISALFLHTVWLIALRIYLTQNPASTICFTTQLSLFSSKSDLLGKLRKGT